MGLRDKLIYDVASAIVLARAAKKPKPIREGRAAYLVPLGCLASYGFALGHQNRQSRKDAARDDVQYAIKDARDAVRHERAKELILYQEAPARRAAANKWTLFR